MLSSAKDMKDARKKEIIYKIVSNVMRIEVTPQDKVDRRLKIFKEKVSFVTKGRKFETIRMVFSSEEDALRYATEILLFVKVNSPRKAVNQD